MNLFLDYLRAFPIWAAVLFVLLGWLLNALINLVLGRRKYVDEETQAALILARGDLKTLRANLDKTTADLNLATTARATLENDLKAHQKNAADLGLRIKDRESQHLTVSGDLKSKLEDLAAAAAGGAALTATINRLTVEKDSHLKDLDAARLRIGRLEGDLRLASDTSKWDAQFKARDAELADWKQQFGRLDADHKAVLATYAEQEARHKDVSDKHATKTSELAAAVLGGALLQNKMSEVSAARAASDEALAEAHARAARLEANLKAHGDNTVKFESSVKMKDTELGDLRARVAMLEVDVKAATEMHASYLKSESAKVSAAAASAAALTASISQLTGEKDATAEALADAMARAVKLEANLKVTGDTGRWINQLSAQDLELADLRARISRLESDARLTGEGGARLEASLRSRDAELAEMRARLTHAEAEAMAAHAMHATTQTELMGKATEFAAAVAGGAFLQTKISEPTGKHADSDKALAEARAQIGSLRAEVNSLQADRDNLKMKLTALPTAPVADNGNKIAATATVEMKAAGAAAKAAANANLPAGVVATVAACPQHLSDVKGIGTMSETRMYASDIGTYWELANLTDDDFKRILNVTDMNMIRVSFADTRAEARRAATESNSIGRTWSAQAPDDFEPLGGIGFTYEKRLYDAGICTYQALANATPEQLEKICIGSRTPPRMPDFASWIARAKALSAK